MSHHADRRRAALQRQLVWLVYRDGGSRQACVLAGGAQQVRVLLDTNVWSNLCRQGVNEDFYRTSKRLRINVVTAPATLLELLRTPQADLRSKSIKFIARSRWERLPTEAESEAMELVSEVRRLRREWMLAEPLLGRRAELSVNWKHGIWEAARRDVSTTISYAKQHALDAREGIVGFQREQSSRWKKEGLLGEIKDFAAKLKGVTAIPAPGEEDSFRSWGWRPGTAVAAWRLEALQHVRYGLFDAKKPYGQPTSGSAYADWFELFVDLNKVRAKSEKFGELLLYEMTGTALPRAWMRWALGMAQHAVAASSGNAVDGQLAVYLYDADLFITSDKRFHRVLEAIRPYSPRPFAAPAYLDPAKCLHRGIEDILSASPVR